MKKMFNAIVQWLFIIGFVLLVVWLVRLDIRMPHMNGGLVLLSGLSLASLWTETWRIGVTKPWNCIGCMTGWFSIILAFMFNTQFWYLYLPIGNLIGSTYYFIKNRWF